VAITSDVRSAKSVQRGLEQLLDQSEGRRECADGDHGVDELRPV
jgi:hypothetical protein